MVDKVAAGSGNQTQSSKGQGGTPFPRQIPSNRPDSTQISGNQWRGEHLKLRLAPITAGLVSITPPSKKKEKVERYLKGNCPGHLYCELIEFVTQRNQVEWKRLF